jgi:hypothetical protein
MKTIVGWLLLLPVLASASLGKDLKGLLECFTWWDTNSATRAGNSQLEGCDPDSIRFCKTDKGHDDGFCEFHGDNHLTPYDGPEPSCYFCCGMETCDSWSQAHDENQRRCVQALLTGAFSKL